MCLQSCPYILDCVLSVNIYNLAFFLYIKYISKSEFCDFRLQLCLHFKCSYWRVLMSCQHAQGYLRLMCGLRSISKCLGGILMFWKFSGKIVLSGSCIDVFINNLICWGEFLIEKNLFDCGDFNIDWLKQNDHKLKGQNIVLSGNIDKNINEAMDDQKSC